MSYTPVRSSVYNRAQFGIETTAGTIVAATKRFQTVSVRWQPDVPVNEFRPEGWRYGIEAPTQKEMSRADVPAAPINLGGDIVYALSSIMHVAAVAGTWVFAHDPFNPQAIQTYTVERGAGTTGEKVGFSIFDSLSFEWTKEVANMSGSIFGQALATGQTMATSGVTDLTRALAIPGKNTIKVGASTGSLTKLTGCLRAGFTLNSVYSPNFYLDEADRNFGDVKSDAPQASASLLIKNDSVAAGYLADLRASTKRYCQIQSFGVLGPNSGADPYELKILFPFQFVQQQFTDEQGLEASPLTLRPVYDSTLGYSFQITVVNLMGTL